MLKNTLMNPQNEQKLLLKIVQDEKSKESRAFARKIDMEVRQKIKKRRARELVIEVKKPQIERQKEEEEEDQAAQAVQKKSLFSKNNLHIKQTALLNACRENKTNWLRNSAYNYSKADVNITD